MKKVCGWTVSALLMAAVSSSAMAQFAKPEDAIKYRKAAMTVMGAHFGRIAAMAGGKVPFDAKIAAENAAIVEEMAKLPWHAFVEGSDKGETRAKAEIWSDSARFKGGSDKFQGDTAKLSQAAKTGNLDAIKAAVGAVGGSCKTCHDNFRKD